MHATFQSCGIKTASMPADSRSIRDLIFFSHTSYQAQPWSLENFPETAAAGSRRPPFAERRPPPRRTRSANSHTNRLPAPANAPSPPRGQHISSEDKTQSSRTGCSPARLLINCHLSKFPAARMADLAGDIPHPIQYQPGPVGILLHGHPVGDAGEHQNGVKTAFDARNDVRIHAVSDHGGIF